MKQLLLAATATLLFFTACDALNTKQVTIKEKSKIYKLDFYDFLIGTAFASYDSVQSYITTDNEIVYVSPGQPLPKIDSKQTATAEHGISNGGKEFETLLMLETIK